ncbi:TetR/AcrR family transcriptional regulator [Phenylobacterium sp. J367]|uniref:TetR/AcrR family transcriptional regulator n=1 Tax=Phenylobacterium sp. J367 TaxID=2898435 RepID=UPI002151D474|nr:TetR/AcrR family transcriptional regulator [Phenylobacterium sp. J367]MCR5878207.1 TetR/AcrR family transcriptional regulator [Phenylobacterium sp. J367]
MQVNLAARAAAAEAKRAQTRDRLLAAAERVIAEKGVDAASIEDFVAAAGVSRGTFYNYFPSLADLVAALNQSIAASMGHLLDALPFDEDPARDLARRLHLGFAMAIRDPVRGWVLLRLIPAGAARQSLMEERFMAAFARCVERGRFRACDPRAASTLTFGMLRMAQRDMLVGSTQPEKAIELIAMLFVAFGLDPEDAAAISAAAAEGAYDTAAT